MPGLFVGLVKTVSGRREHLYGGSSRQAVKGKGTIGEMVSGVWPLMLVISLILTNHCGSWLERLPPNRRNQLYEYGMV